MGKKLVAYFSTRGITANVAKTLAAAVEGDIYEIQPKVPYTDADLDWQDENSRSSVEMRDFASRPQIAGSVPNTEDYDVIFVGFPIWWYIAPTIINTFLESCDLSGKIIVPFATSGSSGMGETTKYLAMSCPNSCIIEGCIFKSNVTQDELSQWVATLEI